MSQFVTSCGQSWVSASTSVLPMNIQDWFPLGWTGWISWQFKGLSRVFSSLLQHHSSKASILWHSAFFIVQLSYPHMTAGKTITLTRQTYILYKSESRSVVSNSLWLRGLYSPWNSSGQNTAVGSHYLLQAIFPTHGLNPGLTVCLQFRRPRFNPWVRKIPWRRKWQPTPVVLPGKIPWTEDPGRLQSMGSQRDTIERRHFLFSRIAGRFFTSWATGEALILYTFVYIIFS